MTLDLVITILLIAFIAFGVCVSIPQIGKDRKPLQAGQVVLIMIIDAAMIVGILHLYWT